MTDTASIVAHYLEQIVRRVGLKGFDEMRAEIESADEADARRRAALLIATASLAVATIQEVPEFAGDDMHNPDYRCLWCLGDRPYKVGRITGGGHEPDCQRQKTLAALRDVLGQKAGG